MKRFIVRNIHNLTPFNRLQYPTLLKNSSSKSFPLVTNIYSIHTNNTRSLIKPNLKKSYTPKNFQQAFTNHTSTKNRNGSRKWTKFGSFGIGIGLATVAVGYYGLNNNESFNYAVMATKRIFAASKATVLVMFHYYTDFPDLLTEEEGLKNPEEQLRRLNIRSRTHRKCAETVRECMLKNGGVYIKFGQHLSAMSYILPVEWTQTMIPLQDKCTKSSMESLNQVFKQDLGEEIDDMFEWFDENPIGVASLAQVHKAKLANTGELVAVKVQHPDVRQFSSVDISVVTALFKLVYKVFPDFEFMWLSDEMNTSLPQELDFRNEKKNSEQIAKNFSKRPHIPLT
ncbi:hypothetical protein BB559_003299 [Furculomyces boomerangus]|nr:hypothetical protein BB559_003299 [Furculomyces boomerangus]